MRQYLELELIQANSQISSSNSKLGPLIRKDGIAGVGVERLLNVEVVVLQERIGKLLYWLEMLLRLRDSALVRSAEHLAGSVLWPCC